jgi:hypothetical protein
LLTRPVRGRVAAVAHIKMTHAQWLRIARAEIIVLRARKKA